MTQLTIKQCAVCCNASNQGRLMIHVTDPELLVDPEVTFIEIVVDSATIACDGATYVITYDEALFVSPEIPLTADQFDLVCIDANGDYAAEFAEQGQVGPEGPEGPEGPQGIQGIQGIPGENGTNGTNGEDGNFINSYEGVWAGGDYLEGDIVFFDGSSWIATANTTGADVPGAAAVWELVAQEGDQGIQGLQGIQGVQGIQGTVLNSNQGAWVSGAYDAGDIVTHEGSTWMSTTAITTEVPGVDSEWQLLAVAGQSGFIWGGVPDTIATNSNNALDLTIPGYLVYQEGDIIKFIAGMTNSTAMTMDVNSIGPVDLVYSNNQPITTNSVIIGRMYSAVYDGTSFRLEDILGREPIVYTKTAVGANDAPGSLTVFPGLTQSVTCQPGTSISLSFDVTMELNSGEVVFVFYKNGVQLSKLKTANSLATHVFMPFSMTFKEVASSLATNTYDVRWVGAGGLVQATEVNFQIEYQPPRR